MEEGLSLRRLQLVSRSGWSRAESEGRFHTGPSGQGPGAKDSRASATSEWLAKFSPEQEHQTSLAKPARQSTPQKCGPQAEAASRESFVKMCWRLASRSGMVGGEEESRLGEGREGEGAWLREGAGLPRAGRGLAHFRSEAGSGLAAHREALGPRGRRSGEGRAPLGGAGGGWRRRERRRAELPPSMARSGGGGRSPAWSSRSQPSAERAGDEEGRRRGSAARRLGPRDRGPPVPR